MKNIIALIGMSLLLASCSNDAQVASYNLSQDADNFKINRRIVFYNGITGEYMLVVEGRCSLGSATTTKGVTVTCKTGNNEYKKHILALSDNVTIFAEQVDAAKASPYHYRVVFKPAAIIPDIEIRK